jgi:hypothetical protein
MINMIEDLERRLPQQVIPLRQLLCYIGGLILHLLQNCCVWTLLSLSYPYAMNLIINKTANTHMVMLISLARPAKSLINTYPRIPQTSPSAMLYAKGIIAIVKNAGIASVKSVKLIFMTGSIMYIPTITRAGAVAAAGIRLTSGAKKRDNRNNAATVTAVSPVRPPSATPDASQSVPYGFLNQHGSDRRVHSAGQSGDCSAVTNPGLDFLN